jgi:outer membrane scaffolding protein for murein synthesis (MipA/OmpV family)
MMTVVTAVVESSTIIHPTEGMAPRPRLMRPIRHRAAHRTERTARAVPWIIAFTGLLSMCAPGAAWSQTPSPLQEWQYSSGEVLKDLFQPKVPEWHYTLGLATEFKPLYDGSKPYRLVLGPVIDVRYRDIAFASVGEGLGVNLLRGLNYRAGVTLGYDLGRRESYDSTHLHGLEDIGAAPVVKIFASYAISRRIPLVFRGDVRQFIGGADGMIADLEAYMPLPGSSKTLILFAGPSVTFADHRYLQKMFGVTAAQAAVSGYPEFAVHGGSDAVGLGFSATRIIRDHWLINANLAVNRLLGSAGDSPVTQSAVQKIAILSFGYQW